MKITLKILKENHACLVGMIDFANVFPNGCDVNAANVRKAIKSNLFDLGDITWVVDTLFTEHAKNAFYKARNKALSTFFKARGKADKIFNKAHKAALKTYEKAIRRAIKDIEHDKAILVYHKAIRAARKPQEAAKEAARKAYFEARVAAFVAAAKLMDE